MQFNQNTFTSTDNHTIYTYEALPDGDFDQIVLIVHGYGEHFARYEHVVEALVTSGTAVYGIDHRGHGRSTGERAIFKAFEQPIADIHVLMKNIKSQHSNKKVYMLGHSMGSLLALTYTIEHQQELTGLIVTGVAITGSENVSPMVRTIGSIIARFRPSFPIAPAGEMTILTRDPDMVKKAEDDPMMYKGAWKAGMGTLILDVGEKLQTEVHKITMPILIMHGSADELTPLSGSQYVHEHVSSQDKTLQVWEGMLHEIFNEVGRDEVIQTMIDWIHEH